MPAAKFKSRAATGVDCLEPSALGLLSDDGLLVLGLLLRWIEALAGVPPQAAEVFIIFPAKPDGCWQPAGLRRGLIRLLDRIGHDGAKDWGNPRGRSLLFGGQGRSC